MSTKSVLVECEDGKKQTVHGSSGILIANRYVIFTANILSHLIKLDGYENLPTRENSCLLSPHSLLTNSPTLNVVIPEKSRNEERHTYKRGRIRWAWISENIRKSCERDLKDWTVDHESDHRVKELLPSLFVLDVDQEAEEDVHHFKLCLCNLLEEAMEVNVATGSNVVVKSTPFGNRRFVDSYSQGIVSNVVGNEKCLILSDAPTAPGAEGGGLYIKSR